MSSDRFNSCQTVVVGAGPYGLSVAAHLKHAQIVTRVFGEPMAFWRRHMPKGMMLRSAWHATHISSPDGTLSLDAFAAAHGVRRDAQLSLRDFVAYGEWFARHAVPDLDRRSVRLVESAGHGFRVTLVDGEAFAAERVVIATGLTAQDHRPPVLRDLPAPLVSHCSDHDDLAPFRGRRVAVVGRGQSACETAALLAEFGAEVEIICRGEIHWLGSTADDTSAAARLSWRMREALGAPSGVGPFPLGWLAEAPAVVWRLPKALREMFTRRCLKPGAAAWVKPRLKAVRCNPGQMIRAARAHGDGVELQLNDGVRTFDHVILATGYQVDLARLDILSAPLLSAIDRVEGSPVLRAGFESSVPGLHFVGSSSVRSFGPLMRFVAGAPFAARSVAKAARSRGASHTNSEARRAPAKSFLDTAPDLSPPR